MGEGLTGHYIRGGAHNWNILFVSSNLVSTCDHMLEGLNGVN